MAKSRTAFQREIDDTLTEQFNNVPSVRAFLLKKIARLTQHLEEKFGDDVRVFIKGGSSLNIMKKVKSNIEPSKWSDFDNQIIINPNLPIYRWYQIFSEVHNYLKEEYMPRFQQDWEAFLTANRKELDEYQQRGLSLFKGNLIDNQIFDFPTLEFSAGQHGSVSANQMKSSGQAAAKDQHKLDLTLTKGYQSNLIFNSGMVSLHPLNHFDNAMLLPQLSDEVGGVLKQQGLHQDDVFYNSFFPPAPMPLDATLNANENPYSSSILVNNSISKFVLYRVIVRYVSDQYSSDGTPRLSAGDDDKLGDEHKMFGSTLTKFRGELLDVSIPRRDSYETIQQWAQVNTMPVLYQPAPNHYATWLNVPGWKYQLNENVLMILEVFDNISGSPHKFYKRVLRGCNAVAAINESYNKRYPVSSKEFKALEQSIDIKNFKTAFTTLSKHKTLGFLRPLVKDLFDTVQNDYGWKNLAGNLTKLKLKKCVDVNSIIGTDIEKSLKESWERLKNDKPDKSSHKTFDAILIKEVKDKIDGRSKVERDADYEKAKMMLGFMRFYHNIHDQFSNTLEFFDKPKSGFDLHYLNDFRMDLEKNANVDQAVLCGQLSSMVHTKLMTGKSEFEYHFPYVEMFILSSEKAPITTLEKQLAKFTGVESVGGQLSFEKDDFTALPSIVVKLNNFELPVVIRVINSVTRENAIAQGKFFEAEEQKSAEKLKAIRLEISGIRRQLSRLFVKEVEMTNEERYQGDIEDLENEMLGIENSYLDSKLGKSLEVALQKSTEAAQTEVENAKSMSYKKQLQYTFSPLSTVNFILDDGSNFRILLAAEAVKHMDLKIAYTESFYQLHWLDHQRVEYKNMITTFPPKRIDMGDSKINVSSNLLQHKPKLSFSAIAKTDFSQPLKYQEDDMAQVVTQIRTLGRWANVGGDIAPLLMSQLLQFPIEVASAGSPDDVLEGRLTQIHLFDRRLDNNFQLVNMTGFNLRLANIAQAIVQRTTCIRVAKIGNHYWIRDENGGLTNTASDGDCFYHAVISYIAQSNQKTIQNLRTALADFAEVLRTTNYRGSNRLQYIVDNIGALENSFRPLIGYHEVALRDVTAAHRGIIRNLKLYLVDGGRDNAQDRASLHEILRDADAIHNWSRGRQNLIQLARQFVLNGARPLLNALPSDHDLGLL